MKYVAFDACVVPQRTDSTHFTLFHGRAERGGIRWPNNTSSFLGDSITEPLRISVGNPVPALFRPGMSLVINSHVRKILQSTNGVDFGPVEFTSVVNHPYSVGAFGFQISQQDVAAGDDFFGELLSSQQDVPHLHPPLGEYRELLLCNVYRSANEDLHQAALVVQLPDYGVDCLDCLAPLPSMLGSPFWSKVFFFPRDLMDSISPFIEWDFFSYTAVDL